jgi:uncharacterized protein (DUF924 family)
MEVERSEVILDYWFGTLKDARPLDMSSLEMKRWFGENVETDREIVERFEGDYTNASQGHYGEWEGTPRGSLALVILLDQFPRNMYRRTPKAFETDPLAQSVAVRAIDLRMDQSLTLTERMFLYMPLMHSEDLALQQKALRLYEQLVKLSKEHSPANADFFVFAYGFERKHYVIVERFGRYPHRNEILGRQSTAAEIEFLTQPGSSF